MTQPLQMNIQEAAAQLAEAQAEVERVQRRIVDVQSESTTAEQDARALAQALMDGTDVSAIQMPRLSGAQTRHAVQALQGLLADAQSRAAQARGALRRARVTRLREIHEEAQVAFDAAAATLLDRYADVCCAADRLAAATGVDPRPGSWWNLAVPRARQAKVGLFFDGTTLTSRGQDVTSSAVGAAANARLSARLKEENIE
jgi:hypothetical protein